MRVLFEDGLKGLGLLHSHFATSHAIVRSVLQLALNMSPDALRELKLGRGLLGAMSEIETVNLYAVQANLG